MQLGKGGGRLLANLTPAWCYPANTGDDNADCTDKTHSLNSAVNSVPKFANICSQKNLIAFEHGINVQGERIVADLKREAGGHLRLAPFAPFWGSDWRGP